MLDVPNCIPSPQPDPLRDRTVLLLRFRELLLRAEGFVGLYRKRTLVTVPRMPVARMGRMPYRHRCWIAAMSWE